jgi:PHP family Zn ribbon phosphoesterase
MEVCSREEVHLLTLFGDIEHVRDLQSVVYAHLAGENRPDVFGYQIIADEADHVLGENPRLLIGATGLSLEQIVSHTHARCGLALCSHVDRPANGILGQLGLIPPDLEVDGVEVSHRTPLARARQILPAIGLRPCVTSSDAHSLADIGRAHTVLRMAEPTLKELAFALRGELGREVVI